MPRYQQLDLGVHIRPKQEVSWIVAEEAVIKRRRWFGNKVTSRIVTDEKGGALRRTINADDVSKIKDPNLAYSLRFADAVNSIGWIKDEPGSFSSWRHMVTVEATDEGFDSRLINATYTGLERDFEETLHRFGPTNEDN